MHHARFRPKRKPQCARPHGDQHHNRYENTGNLIRHALYRSFGTLRGLHQSNDLREHHIFADFCGTIPQRSGTVDRGTGHTAANLLQHWHGFTGDHGFVDRRCTGNNRAVNGKLFPRTNRNNISDQHLIDRNFLFDFIAHHASGFRLQFRQCTHGFSRTDASACFKQLPDQHQRDDHTNRFKIRFSSILRQNLRHKRDHTRVGKREYRTQTDQCVHFRRAVNDRSETATKNRQCSIAHHRQHQYELHPIRHRIQHQHRRSEYRNRNDGRHNKPRNQCSHFTRCGRII